MFDLCDSEKKEKKKTIKGSTEIPVSTLMCLLRGTAEACRRSTQLEKYFRPRPSMRLTLRQPRPGGFADHPVLSEPYWL